VPGALLDVGRPAPLEEDAHAGGGLGDHPERRADVGVEVEVGIRLEAAPAGLEGPDALDRERADLPGLVVEPHHVEPAAAVPDAVGVERAGGDGAGAAGAIAHAQLAAPEHRVVQGLDRLAQVRVVLVGAREHAEGVAQARQVVGELGAESGPDLCDRGADRVVEDGAFERPQQVLSERQCEDLVGRERHVAQAEALEEAVVDAPVALLAHHGEAREHQRVEVAVDRPAHAAEVPGQVVQVDAAPAPGESLDELPLPRELISAHRLSR
jgi:hypothetical protein